MKRQIGQKKKKTYIPPAAAATTTAITPFEARLVN